MRELEVGLSVVIGNVPPWLLPDSVVDPTSVEKRKDWSEVSDIGKLVDNYIGISFYAFLRLFTDGSKDPASRRTGAGDYVPEFDVQICRRLTDELSIYSVELWRMYNLSEL